MWNLILKQVAKRLFPRTPFESLSRAQLQQITSETTKIMNRTKGQTAEVVGLPQKGIRSLPTEQTIEQPVRRGEIFEVLDDDAYRGLQADTFRRLIANTDDDVKAFGKRIIENKQDVKFEKLTKDQRKGILDMIDDRIKMGNRKFMEKYDPMFPPEDFASGGIARVGFAGGLLAKLYKGVKGLQHGAIERKLRKQYIETGMDKFKAYNKAMDDASDVVNQKKLEIVENKMNKVNVNSDDYVDLIDEHIRLTDRETYKDIKRWKNTRPDLADKTRALYFPDWAKTRYGEDYQGVLNKRQASALKEQSDEINRMYPDKSDTDILVDEIDEMNKANIDEIIEGRKKNASGGIARVGMKIGGFTKLEVLINILKNTIKGSKDPWVKKHFPNWIKEIQKNPSLANNENVWRELTSHIGKDKAVKNQRLIVHSDDSVDFFTQSKFGPHNIEKTLEFQKKHNLSRDQANKILQMEPEDRVLEMKRLETIRNRTMQAEGGIAGELHLNRPGYSNGKKVDLSALESLKGLKRSDGIIGVGGGLQPQAGIRRGLEGAQSEYIAKFFSGLSLLDKEKQNYAYKILENKIGSVALDLQTKQTGIETAGVKKFTGLDIPTRIDENTLYDILTTIKLPGNLKSEIMTQGGTSGVENYTIGLSDAKNKLGIQYDDNTGQIVANYRVDVGSGSVTPIITKTGENIQTLTTGTFPLSEDKVPVRMGNETVMVPKKSIGSVIQTDKESDLSDINITYSDIGESLLKGSYREDDYDKSLKVEGFKKLPKNIELSGSYDKNLETGLDQSTAGINIPIGEYINLDLSKTQGDYKDDESAKLKLGKTWETSVGDVSTQGWVDDEGEWHAGVLWSTQFGEKEKPPKVYEGTSISELDKVLKRKKLYAKGGLAKVLGV